MPSWAAFLVAFISSACVLVLEIVAGRVLAPHVGVSLYTWTSVIGVVLAGLALGNFLGGVAADRWPNSRTLALALLASGLATLATPFLAQLVGLPPLDRLAELVRIVAGATVGFFLPAALLGAVSPILVRLLLRDLSRAGHLVGRLYACATAGSILGTFATGFVLIPAFGTRAIIVGVGVILLLLAALAFWLGRLDAGRVARAGGVAALALALLPLALSAAGWPPAVRAALESGCLRESSYFCIRILEDRVRDDSGLRQVQTLMLDHMAHSVVDPDDPTYLRYSYIRLLAGFVDYAALQPAAPRAIFFGGGGYSVPRYLVSRYPLAEADVVEIDPIVTEVARERLGLREDARLRTYAGDGRLALESLSAAATYDIAVGDAFNDLSVPYHLATREFAQQVLELLGPDGLYATHAIDRLHSGNFLRSYVHTLRSVFPHVYVLGNVPDWQADPKESWVVVASRRPLDPSRLARVPGLTPDRNLSTALMPPDAFDAWLIAREPVLFTDDYVPVDTLLAPLFFDRIGG